MAKLILKLADTVLKEIPLDGAQLTIGRKADNDVVVDDPSVSSRHAKITQVQSVFFIEDLGSTNGTTVNDKPVDRRQLKADDRIVVGKHVLVFREDVNPGAEASAPVRAFDSERTMMLDAKTQRDLLKGKPGAAGKEVDGAVGMLQVLSGRTDKKLYALTGRLSTVGSAHSSTVKLTGWFAPKTAAMISRGKEGYSVSMSDEGKKVLVNGTPIEARADLKDGDLLEVAGVTLYFCLKEHGQS